MLEDAASELFLEQTYALTTIDQITKRAGVSRNTFFNYFGSKSDLLWVELDLSIERLAAELGTAPIESSALDAAVAAILRAVDPIGVDRIPLALTQQQVMGVAEEAKASGLVRFARRADLLAAFLATRLGRPPSDLVVQVAATALSAAVTAAWAAWADAGVSRHPLREYVTRAIEVLGLDDSGWQ